jgi:hypothetical protein
MAWQTPKTNWGAADVPLPDDFNRIEGNTQHLKDEVDSHKAENASTTAKGHVQLNNTVTSTSTTQAATANAVKTVNDALTSHKAAAAPHSGHETPAGAQAKAEAAAGAVQAELDVHLAEKATTSKTGHVKLDNTLTSTSTTLAATANAVRTVNNSLNNHISSKSVHGLKDTLVAIGAGSSAHLYSSVAVGEDAKALGSHSLALGSGAEVPNYQTAPIAIGRNASAQSHYSMALGANAEVSSSEATAIGVGALANNTYDVVLGRDSSNVKVPGNFNVSGTKNFEIPHPKPTKRATHVLRHGTVESPTVGDTLYRWRVLAPDDNGLVLIDLPDYFIHLNKDVQIFVTPQGHFGNGYGVLDEETEQLEIHCQLAGEYNVLVIGTRNDDHQSVQDWYIKGVEREIGESWTGETYVFSVDEILEVEEIKEVSA